MASTGPTRQRILTSTTTREDLHRSPPTNAKRLAKSSNSCARLRCRLPFAAGHINGNAARRLRFILGVAARPGGRLIVASARLIGFPLGRLTRQA
jgi:hypothetical protein